MAGTEGATPLEMMLKRDPEIVGLDVADDEIDRRIYHDQSVYDRENKAIFERAWQYVCHESELGGAGDFVTAMIAGQPIVVTRGKDGELRAMENACTHRGAMLETARRGHCGSILRCMYHGWSFNLEGQLVGVPYPQAYGNDWKNEDHALATVHVATYAGLVFAAINPLAPTIEEFLGEAAEYVHMYFHDTEVLGRVSWTYEGNWKLWHENFCDNYHPQFVHKFVRVVNNYGGPEPNGVNLQLDLGHAHMSWMSSGPPDLARYGEELKKGSGIDVDAWEGALAVPFPENTTDREPHNAIFTLFPNFDYQYSANDRVMLIQIVTPLSVDETKIELTVLGRIGESEEVRAYRREHSLDSQGSWGKVSADDMEAAIRTHQGTKSVGTPRSTMGRGVAPGKQGTKYDEYSLRSFYFGWRHYMAALETA